MKFFAGVFLRMQQIYRAFLSLYRGGSRCRTGTLFLILSPFFMLLTLLSALCVPFNVDEGVFISVLNNLRERAEYRISFFDGADHSFHAGITTGPTVLLPAAGAIEVFGINKFALRFVPWIYTLCLLFLSSLVAWRLYGLRAALIASLMLTANGYFMGISTSLLGESAAMAFLLASFWFADRSVQTKNQATYFWVALFFGLGALAKLQWVLALFGYYFAAFWGTLRGGGLRTWSPALASTAGLFLIYIVWFGIQAAWSGIDSFSERLASYGHFTRTGFTPRMFGANLPLLGTIFPWAVYVLALVWACLELGKRRDDLLWKLVAGTALGWLAWFIFLDGADISRHAFPGVVCVIILCSGAIVHFPAFIKLPGSNRFPVAKILLYGCLGILVLVQASRFWGGLKDQDMRFASLVAEHTPPDAILYGAFNLPPVAIGFLAGREVARLPVTLVPQAGRPAYFVVSEGEDYWFSSFRDARLRLIRQEGKHRLFAYDDVQPLIAPNSLNSPQRVVANLVILGKREGFADPAKLTLLIENRGTAFILGPMGDGQGACFVDVYQKGQNGLNTLISRASLTTDVPPRSCATIELSQEIDAMARNDSTEIVLASSINGSNRIFARLSTRGRE